MIWWPAIDPERLQDALKRHGCPHADGPHIRFLAVKKKEDGLLDRDDDRADEPDVSALPAKLVGRGLHRLGRDADLVFADAGPIALDDVVRRVIFRHVRDAMAW